MEKYQLTLLLVMASLLSGQVYGRSEGGLITGLEAEKKMTKKWTVGMEADMRTRNDFKTMDRWSVGLYADYKCLKWVKASAGYVLLDNHFSEKREDYISAASNAKIKWRPSYWGFRHRFHASFTLSHKFSNNIRLSLRERWQYTYRPSATPERYKLDVAAQTMKLDGNYVRGAKGKNQLRSRFQIEYDRKRSRFTPYVNMELYNSWQTEKIRYNAGTDVKIGRHHVLTLFYRLQDIRQADDDDVPDMHYAGVTYKFKF